MKSGKHFVIASKADPASFIYLEKVLGLLCGAHPRYSFVDFRDLGGRQGRGVKTTREFGHLIGMLEKKVVDIVVVNAREIPLRLHTDVSLVAVPKRGNPFDVLIAREELILDEQPEHVRLAVTDPVSRGQLLYYRPDLVLRDESADVGALNELMERDEIDGFVTAAMEIEAFNQQDRVVEVFTSSICTPLAGQGAIGILTRNTDRETRSAVGVLNDSSSLAEVELERMLFHAVCKDGRASVGVLANVEGDLFEIEAAITALDGSEKILGSADGIVGFEEEVVGKLASDLLEAGGNRIIRDYR